jgi:hypothetical protein
MAVRIVVKQPLKGIDLDKSLDALDRVMKDFTLNALKTFVIDSTGPIPVWSGASRATFKKLAAIARTQIDIRPVAYFDGRGLGDSVSTGTLIAEPDVAYGWEWATDLYYIDIVDGRVGFQEAGIRAVQDLKPNLPGVEVKV